MAKAGRPIQEVKRTKKLEIRLTEEEYQKIEELAEKLKMNKSRMARNIILGELGELNFLHNVDVIPIIQNGLAFYRKMKGENLWEDIKND